jgi:replicative DNA helicase
VKPQVQRCEPTRWPSDLMEERSALGACIMGQAAEAARLLEADDFSLGANREIFSAICALVEREETALEIGLLAGELRFRGVLDHVGGVPYLEDLDSGVVVERSMQSRAKVLRDIADRRRLLRTAEEVERRALDWSQSPSETLGWLRETTR